MIELQDLVVIYPNGRVANRGIDALFPTQGLFIITGPNGSGKSTFLNVMSGNTSPSAGHLIVNGGEIASSKFSAWCVEHVELMSQDIQLDKTLTVKEHTDFMKGKTEKILQELEFFNITDQKISLLPRDQRQLVGILISANSTKDILLFDEPTKYLDKEQKDKVWNYLNNIAKEKLVVVATHDYQWAEIAESVLHIQDGRIVQAKHEVPQLRKDRFGWEFRGELRLPLKSSQIRNTNVHFPNSLAEFNDLLSASKKKIFFDPEFDTYDHMTVVEVFEHIAIAIPERLLQFSNQQLGKMSGGERNLVYLHLQFSINSDELFLLYPSLNLDEQNLDWLNQAIESYEEKSITLFDLTT